MALSNPHFIEILMPPLMKRWSKLQDDNDDLVPLLEVSAGEPVSYYIYDRANANYFIVSGFSYHHYGWLIPSLHHACIPTLLQHRP